MSHQYVLRNFISNPLLIFPVQEEKTQEELDRQAERKKEAGRRLQEMAIAKRKEKVYIADMNIK